MLSFLYALKATKLDYIQRLNECQSKLQGKQGEFNDNQSLCLEPELTKTTWHGTHATDFDDIREEGIRAPYLDIADVQFSKVYKAITTKIASLNQEIEEIQKLIDSILAKEAAESMKLV